MIGSNQTQPHLPLTGLFEIAFEAIVDELRVELEQSEFSDVRFAHSCVFRYVKAPGLRLTEIAELGNMTKQSAGELVDDLAGLGYVERAPDPDDRRAKLIRLTERGKAAQRFGFRMLHVIEKRWGERYGAERVAGLRAILEEIAVVEAPLAMPEAAVAAPARL